MAERDFMSVASEEATRNLRTAANASTVAGANALERGKPTLVALVSHELHRFLRRSKIRRNYRRFAMSARFA
jgi:hypothetical protein